MRLNRRRGLVLGGAIVVVLAGLALWGAGQPWAADHFGYALSGRDALPGHFTYQGVAYSNGSFCAGDSSCDPAAARHWTAGDLGGAGIWPLKQVGTIATLFGTAHPVLEPVHDPSMTGANGPYAGDVHPFVLFVPASDGTYVAFQRPGGP